MRPTQRRQSTVDPGEYVRIVGQTFIKHERAPLLVIGSHQWNRWSLGRLGCPHPMAAARLNRIVQQLGITSLSELADRAHEIGAFTGIGVTAYWTVLAILREAGYDVVAVHHENVSFSSLKRRALKDQPRKRRRRHRG
jgi:hypothetical protein